LPLTLLVFFRIGALGHHRVATAWLVGASLFFYGWWNPAYLGLILSSILFNYALGVALSNGRGGAGQQAVLGLGVTVNLAALGYFKYANFFVDNMNAAFGSGIVFDTVILPLAISFFTFQQIAFLVDSARGETREYDFLHYCLFVTFFPQLIAGPIVHHREMLPQFARDEVYRFNPVMFSVGLGVFAIGLFKKPFWQMARRCFPPLFLMWPYRGHIRRLPKRGGRHWRIPYSSILIFPATPTWPSVSPAW
jgi:D-alanyl-lipoteichoic acid acyltransferase DltB (MBOAT superfamily)